MVAVCLGMCMYGNASMCDECRTMSACVSVCVAMYSVIEWGLSNDDRIRHRDVMRYGRSAV